MDLGLNGKIAMVGGASKGLGFAVARALAAEGACVSIASRDGDAVRRASEAIHAETRGQTLAVAADLSTAGAIQRWHAATVERFGGVDLLYCNTGGPPAGAALSFDDGAWQAAFDSLVMSVVRTIRLVAPVMTARGGGAIVVGTSSSVKEPIANLALSNVLRGSVSALAKTLSLELAASRIRVNQLMPGRIDTDRVRWLDEVSAKRNGIPVADVQARALANIPISRYGQADEFGRTAAFLLSEAASYITGATLQVDGGLLRGVV